MRASLYRIGALYLDLLHGWMRFLDTMGLTTFTRLWQVAGRGGDVSFPIGHDLLIRIPADHFLFEKVQLAVHGNRNMNCILGIRMRAVVQYLCTEEKST